MSLCFNFNKLNYDREIHFDRIEEYKELIARYTQEYDGIKKEKYEDALMEEYLNWISEEWTDREECEIKNLIASSKERGDKEQAYIYEDRLTRIYIQYLYKLKHFHTARIENAVASIQREMRKCKIMFLNAASIQLVQSMKEEEKPLITIKEYFIINYFRLSEGLIVVEDPNQNSEYCYTQLTFAIIPYNKNSNTENKIQYNYMYQKIENVSLNDAVNSKLLGMVTKFMENMCKRYSIIFHPNELMFQLSKIPKVFFILREVSYFSVRPRYAGFDGSKDSNSFQSDEWCKVAIDQNNSSGSS